MLENSYQEIEWVSKKAEERKIRFLNSRDIFLVYKRPLWENSKGEIIEKDLRPAIDLNKT